VRFAFQSQHLMIGFAARASRGGEERAPVVFREFLTSDDGDRLMGRLTEIWSALTPFAPSGSPIPLESQVDHIVAVMHPDRRVEVWINEVAFAIKAKCKRDVAAGEGVLRDDIVDVAEMVPVGVQIPTGCGFAIMFSVGWRKGLVYDFGPLLPRDQMPAELREALSGKDPVAVPRLLGGLYSYLQFRSRFVLTEEDWRRLLDERWFAFSGLPAGLLDEMIQHVRAGWRLDDLLPKISSAVRGNLPRTRAMVAGVRVFARHRRLIGDALSSFERGEHQLAAAALYPVVEGLLREHHAVYGAGKAKPEALAESATQDALGSQFSLLLPLRFKEYLTKVFFGPEDFSDPAQVTRATRHAVAHGVASDDVLAEKAAIIGVLLIEQLAYLLQQDVVSP
jgi:hypothetical protein